VRALPSPWHKIGIPLVCKSSAPVETAKPGDLLANHNEEIEIVPPVYCAQVPGWSRFNRGSVARPSTMKRAA
jgi:hypothetical protein